MSGITPREWQLRTRSLALSRPLVMGIVNVTPDSFSDGGRFATHDLAVAQAMRLVEEGADILDVGGESTRPGASPVPADEELARVLPVVTKLCARVPAPVSVDTMKPAVARACVDVGAEIVNDVTGLADDDMAAVVRDSGAAAVVMHMRGTPQTMQLNPSYDDVVAEVAQFFETRLRHLTDLGIAAEKLAIDPGIGFGKNSEHNLTLLGRLGEYRRLGRPVVLGVSRKGFLGRLLQRDVNERLAAGLAATCHAVVAGAADIIRTHDVAATRDAIITLDAIRQHLR